MNEETERPKWIKRQTLAKDFEIIQALETDPVRAFKHDPSGHYVLIKVLHASEQIAVSLCNAKHEIVKEFRGRRPRDLWTSIFDYEERHGLSWFTRKDHMAYLGKELKKAELALALGTGDYFQE